MWWLRKFWCPCFLVLLIDYAQHAWQLLLTWLVLLQWFVFFVFITMSNINVCRANLMYTNLICVCLNLTCALRVLQTIQLYQLYHQRCLFVVCDGMCAWILGHSLVILGSHDNNAGTCIVLNTVASTVVAVRIHARYC